MGYTAMSHYFSVVLWCVGIVEFRRLCNTCEFVSVFREIQCNKKAFYFDTHYRLLDECAVSFPCKSLVRKRLQNYCRSQFVRRIPGVSVSSQLKIHRLVKKLGQTTF